jgi:glycosyltransferase involved in cell wall biosynthesis
MMVSIVINTLNRCNYLKQLLLALREQSFENFEVIVVNGPSVDGTDKMLSPFRDRIRLASCDVACVGRSRNIGVNIASGEIVAFIDDDAIPHAEWIQTLVTPYRDIDVAAVGGPVFDLPLGRVVWTRCTCTRFGASNTESEGPIDRYLGRGADPFAYLPGCNMSFRRRVLEELGGFNALLSYNYDDAEICSRAVDRGYRIHWVEDALVQHHRAPNAGRDGSQGIRDPYHEFFCRAVFAMHCCLPARSDEEVITAIQRAADAMAGHANDLLKEGRLTPGERDEFIARARSGAEDGLRAGRGARQLASFSAASRSLFLPYR